MRLHEQARAVLMKPATAVPVAQLDKIHGTVVFIGPIVVLDAADSSHPRRTTLPGRSKGTMRRSDIPM